MSTPNLPPGLSPDALDTLTELTTILTKLRSSQSTLNPSQPGQAPLPAPLPGSVTGTTPLPSGSANTSGAFSVKDLTPATDNLKHKLQRARAAVRTLPDVGRTLEQQEAEIKDLEKRRREQLAMLGRIKAVGLEQGRREEGERMVE